MDGFVIIFILCVLVLVVALFLKERSRKQGNPKAQGAFEKLPEEEQQDIRIRIRKATATVKSEDAPLADLMREWFPGLGEEHWEAVLNPIRMTHEIAESIRADAQEMAPASGLVPDYQSGLDHLEDPDPQERLLRYNYRDVLELRLECEDFPDQAAPRERLKEAEDKMRSFAEALVFQLRESIWRDVMPKVDDGLEDLDRALGLIESIGLCEWESTKDSIRYLPISQEVIQEFGNITDEDRELAGFSGDLAIFNTSAANKELEAKGVDLLTEEGQAHAAQLYRQFRAEQTEFLDHFRNRRVRQRLAAKRAQLGMSPSQAEEEAPEAATVRGERFERHVNDVLSAEWPEFECEHLGKHKQTERGIDLLFLGPNGERIGVQCKQHAEAREPSYQEWQSFLGGCAFHKIPEGSRVFVTTGTLSIRQRQEAKKLGVIVFYKDELAEMATEHEIEPWS
jgi:hypothetical protein